MSGSEPTTVEAFEASSVKNRRLLRQEELILAAATALCELLERKGVTKTELAKRLGVTKGFVTQILAGDKNLTLRTIADVADALGHRVYVGIQDGRPSRMRLLIGRPFKLDDLAKGGREKHVKGTSSTRASR
jgi:transcriptional regulator with XRE-family HTH domain